MEFQVNPIPFNKPALMGREIENMMRAVLGGHVSGDGDFTKRCQKLLEEQLGVPAVFLTTSCTDALEMSALLLELKPGDEVIIPSFTFVSTANAFVLRGAKPVFADIRPDTLNLDETQLEALITPRTKAIVVVHYAGVGCEMDVILDIADRHGIPVIEDNAHGLFGRYRDKNLGTFGQIATLSFHETKNFSCGEGGALMVNDTRFIERSEILRDKGTNRSRFFRGQVDKYTWVDIGSSFLPSDLLAAFLFAQLEAKEKVFEARSRIWHSYDRNLRHWAQTEGVSLPVVPSHCEQSYHMYYLLLPNLETRQAFLAHLRSRGVLAVFHYLPLNTSPMGMTFGARPGDCPVTEDVSDRLVRLPFFNELTEAEQERIIEVVQEFKTES
jgi:dTDP-4-amino-4,6-dideoxygalactose transaminase